MSKKRLYTVRLYKSADMDILSLAEIYEFDIISALYSAVTAFARGERFLIKLPERRRDPEPVKCKKGYKRMVLRLDIEKDSDTILFLERFKDGSKNTFLRNILRMYLILPATESFLKDPSDMESIYQRTELFRDGCREAEVGASKTRKRKKRTKNHIKKDAPPAALKKDPDSDNEDRAVKDDAADRNLYDNDKVPATDIAADKHKSESPPDTEAGTGSDENEKQEKESARMEPLEAFDEIFDF